MAGTVMTLVMCLCACMYGGVCVLKERMCSVYIQSPLPPPQSFDTKQ